MAINRKIAGIWFGDSHPVRLMGVLNLSPESFFKGSVVKSEKLAVETAEHMVSEGAELLDLGAMSTAPGVKNISVDEERSRLLPILTAVHDATDVTISVDTFRASVAEAAINAGADIINDVSGFKKDPEMLKTLSEYDSPTIIMATDKKIGDPLTMPGIIKSLEASFKLAEANDYDASNIIIDPAIGRWVPEKKYQYNLHIIKELNSLTKLNCPILVGISRKSFIHEILERPDPAERLHGSLCATAIAVYNGAHVVRTHDVSATFDVVRIAKKIRDSKLL